MVAANIEENILDMIPQKPPFVMIDKLLYSDAAVTRTAFRVKEDNIFIEYGEFCAPGLVENIAQTAAARAGYLASIDSRPATGGYIATVKNLEIFALPRIDDELVTEVAIEKQIFDVTVISGTILCNNELMARCEMKIFNKDH
jgi:predicted hotdog family 3-hydroxylacyl-ACP dehydratase